MTNPIHVLILDDEQSIRWVLEKTLAPLGYQLHIASEGHQAEFILRSHPIDIALIDIHLPEHNGLELMEKMLQKHPQLLAIIMTGQSTMQNTITAMQKGAYDYLAKPFDINEVEALFAQAEEVVLEQRKSKSKQAPSSRRSSHDLLVGNSAGMREVYKAIGRVAATDVTVLIRGESGTGKELVARSIHQNSKRSQGSFIPINCAAIPSELLESELFGHEKGAFTGATERKRGKFEIATAGTVFLDEIGDMPLELQGKLLRVLQEKSFERVGGHESIRTNMRVIAATHQDLEQLIQESRFREDLYYRLNVFSLQLLPLRERQKDVPALVEYFLRRGETELAVGRKQMSEEAMEVLTHHQWPGNVRELENIVKSLMISTVSETITINALPKNLFKASEAPIEQHLSLEEMIYRKLHPQVMELLRQDQKEIMESFIRQMEKPLIQIVLDYTKWNQHQTANILGINRNTLRKKIDYLNLKNKAS